MIQVEDGGVDASRVLFVPTFHPHWSVALSVVLHTLQEIDHYDFPHLQSCMYIVQAIATFSFIRNSLHFFSELLNAVFDEIVITSSGRTMDWLIT